MPANGNGKILSLGEQGGKKDAHGRVLRHNATIEDVHRIAVEEAAKVHEFYLEQIPAFVARMIQDALIGYGLLVPPPGTDITPLPVPQEDTAAQAALPVEGPEHREAGEPPAEPAA
jgi:hypothetical protein